jgi:hypothetical protein
MSDPMPGPNPDLLVREYAPQFLAAERLLGFVWSSLPNRATSKIAFVLMTIVGRSIGSYRAVLHLLKAGYTKQAEMVNRSMFEDMVLGYWLALPKNREHAPEIIDAHYKEAIDRRDYYIQRMNDEGLAAFKDSLNKEDERKATSPIAKRLHERVPEIEELWEECGCAATDLYFQSTISNWLSNLALHASGDSLMDSLRRGTMQFGKNTFYNYGQTEAVDDAEMLDCFFNAGFRFGCLARLLFIELGKPKEYLDDVQDGVHDARFNLTPSKIRQLGRNDPCWCGSGEKLKKCHG